MRGGCDGCDGQARVPGDRQPAGPPRRRGQGHGARPLRRRRPVARDALRPRAAQPARARPDRAHRHLEGRGARRRPRRGDLGRPATEELGRTPEPRRRRGRDALDGAQRLRARQGTLQGPRHRRRLRDGPAHRRGRPRPDRGRVRSPAPAARRARGDGPERAAAARRPLHHRPQRRRRERRADEHRQAPRVPLRRHRRRLRRGRLRGRPRVRDRDGAPGLHRAAQRHGDVERGRRADGLEQLAGPVRGARAVAHAARPADLEGEGRADGDRRWLRRQDPGLHGADGRDPLEEERAAREDDDDPPGGARGDRPDLRYVGAGEDRRPARRAHRRRRDRAGLRGRRLPRIAVLGGRALRPRSVRHREPARRGLGRLRQQAEGRRLPRARRPRDRVRRRVRPR